jgi:hypothetical protein
MQIVACSPGSVTWCIFLEPLCNQACLTCIKKQALAAAAAAAAAVVVKPN